MRSDKISRRSFLHRSAAAAGAVLVSPPILRAAAESGEKRTATDQVALGRTGLKLSRLGFGTGSNGGSVQRALGAEGFSRLLRYAYDQGITYIDTSETYRIHDMVREAIRGLPREKLFIQTKISGVPEKPLEVLDRFRKELGVDMIDTVLTHCAVTKNWDDERRRVLDALEEAKEKKIIRAHGVSCHSLPALELSARLGWVDVNLVRINPQGAYLDTPEPQWSARSDESHVEPVVEQIRVMRRRGHGVIGMKIIGNGDFTKPEDREKSIRYAMQSGLVDAIVIGFKSTEEIDEAIRCMNAALAAKTA
ncbi:MAG: aldo/keto reductase [Planctomycetes bacterium]|nr:aldo/keto reductase [Planctomycetota bacterium]